MCALKVEITHDESVLLEPQSRPIIHGYEETFEATILCYSLEEIVCEKLRAMLQTRQRFLERGSKRPRARDYYDLWKVLTSYSEILQHNQIKETFPKKCAVREVSYQSVDDFFTPEILSEIETYWHSNLGYYVKNLPKSEVILGTLRELIADYL